MTRPRRLPPVALAPVVVGIDGSPSAAEAARGAALEAGLRGCPLRLVRAFEQPGPDIGGLPFGLDERAVAWRSASEDLSRLRSGVGALVPETLVSTHLVVGPPEDVLAEQSAGAELLVVGAHGTTWPAGPALGHVTTGLLGRVTCPVLVHRVPGLFGPARRGVLVGVDGGPGTDRLLDAAADEARRRGTWLRVLHAWEPTPGDPWQAMTRHAVTRHAVTQHAVTQQSVTQQSVTRHAVARDGTTRTDNEQAADEQERRAVDTAVAALGAADPRLQVDLITTPGPAATLLVDASRTVALVVVGGEHRPGPWSGSGQPEDVDRQLLQRAVGPVLVVAPDRVPGVSPRAGAPVGAPLPGRAHRSQPAATG